MSFIKNKYWPRPVSKRGLFVRLDQSLGLMPLAMRAVGIDNLENIDLTIMLESFPFLNNDIREVYLRVEPFQKNEPLGMAVKRLIGEGHVLEGTGELAAFMHTHPTEVEKWDWVFAERQKMWMHQTDIDGRRRVTGAKIIGPIRHFWRLFPQDIVCNSSQGILVSTPAK